MVLTLIGDLAGSRALQNRDHLQKSLQTKLEMINQKSQQVISPFTITLGDEFQAVYKNAGEVFRHIWEIRSEVHPVKVRCAIGIGELSTELNPKQAIGMDGPAFHLARQAVQELKESGFTLQAAAENMPELPLINESLKLISHISDKWEKNRVEILAAFLRGEDSQSIARALNISSVAVYKNRKAGALEVILQLQQQVAFLLNRKLDNPV
ncbi:MAG: SatD family protein [Calditrichia bacterium]